MSHEDWAAALGMTPTGSDLRNAGAEVAAQAVKQWSEEAARWIEALPRGTTFTAENLTAAIGLPREPGPDRNNAVGAALLRASRSGHITKVGFTQSTRKERHGSAIAVWARAVGEAAA